VARVSGWFVASVGCAVLAGAVSPRTPGRRLDQLRVAGADSARSRRGAAIAVPGGRWLYQGWGLLWRARSAQRTRAALVELADALSAELRAGAAPREALWRAARDQAGFSAVAAAARSPSGDVVSALRDVAALGGGAAAADLATAWVVCESTGGRLAAPVARLAGAWRDEEQVRREVSAALAGPRATAVLLAGLPLAGLAMGASLGADPIGLLRQPSVALFVLAPGLFLEVAGLVWISRITRRAATW
jgi:tight adherence protein B